MKNVQQGYFHPSDIESAKVIKERKDLSRSNKITMIRYSAGLSRKEAEQLYRLAVNPAALALGSLGGKKSAQLLSPEQRIARAKKAVAQREKNRAAKKLPAF